MYQIIGTSKARPFRVLWMLKELDQPFDHQPFTPRSPESLALTPTGKLPVLLVDGTPIPDSAAICTFLADRHNALTFAAGTVERGQQDALTHLILDEFDAVLWAAARHTFILPEDKRVPDVKPSLRWEFEHSATRLADRMSGDFVMGDQMTVPDILLAHCLDWAEGAKFPIPEGWLTDYHARMRARPAYQSARALP